LQKDDLRGFLVRAHSKNTRKGQGKEKMQDTLWQLSVQAQRQQATENGKLDEWERNDEPLLVEALTTARDAVKHSKNTATKLKVLFFLSSVFWCNI
jgi:hypothetical protein